MLNPQRLARVEGSHLVSSLDFEDEVTRGFTFPDPFILIDSTIRKSYFTAGAVTTEAGYLRIAEALGDLGIEHESININWTGSSHPAPQDIALLKAIGGRDFGFTLNVYSDALLGDGRTPRAVPLGDVIGILLDGGADVLAPGIVEAPDAEALRRQKDELAEYFDLARSLGVGTTITFAQAGLRDFDAMTEMADYAISLGATRLDLMDSFSSLSTEAMPIFVRRFRERIGDAVPVTMHMHNEFGLASAGTIAAVTAGASPDVSVNAVSYRAGFAALEEVVLALEAMYGVDTGIELTKIQAVSDLVARETGLPTPPFKALTGPYAYLKNMPGDVAAAMLSGQDKFPPISHALVAGVMGQEVTWVWGGFSSEDMVRNLGRRLGLNVSGDEIPLLRTVLDSAVAGKTAYPRWLSPEEAEALFRESVAIMRAAIPPQRISDIVGDSCAAPVLRAQLLQAAAGEAPALVPGIARRVVMGLDDEDLLSTLAHMNPLGHIPEGESAPEQASKKEESGLLTADDTLRRAISELDRAYQDRFGFPLVIAASGLGAEEIVGRAAQRLASTPEEAASDSRVALATIIERRIRRSLSTEASASGKGAD